jgi:large subunit ribosomal protein L1
MAGKSKRMKAAAEKLDRERQYAVEEALGLVKEFATVKFSESVDVSVNLGVDPRKSDQVVRGSTVLPNGTGKTVRVAVFAQGPNADAATEAGADIVGFEDLAEQIKGGDLNFDVVIATPDAMRVVGPPKVGTVTADVAAAVKNAKAGQVRYRTDKAGIIHCPIGSSGFEVSALAENLTALLADLMKAKPASAKGVFMKKVTVSSTMGPGVAVDQSSIAL